MRAYKQIPTTITDLSSIICDRCGRRSPGAGWADGPWDVDTITVEREAGDVFPECDLTTTTRFDLCPECWEWLVAVLASEGATPVTYRTEDGDPAARRVLLDPRLTAARDAGYPV